ncbi:MAG: GFA family protein [Pseudomonadota bacterium]|nr:GFA family protein [Pseudomonadota bacterium]
MPTGRCHCGAVSYEMPSETVYRALCHCSDCRRHSGAPVVAWGLVPKDQFRVEGETKEYKSSENARRHFCPACGTSLFYTNEAAFPGNIDVQLATLDEPEAMPPELQVQVAERIGWMERAHELPAFERYPG